MGNAVGGLGYYASVLYWNPAGAARIRSVSVVATYIPWLVDTRLQNFSLIVPLQQKFVFGAYITTWNMDDMPVRTEDRQHARYSFQLHLMHEPLFHLLFSLKQFLKMILR